jgi:signal transduction histidine kinase
MKIDGKRVPFDKDQAKVMLKPSTKSLELHFGNFDYTNSKEQLLDYNFLGSEWSALDGNKLILNNLKSGVFELKVRILNFDGNFVPKAFLMKVIVKPPFRQTWWFIALVSSLTGFIIWSVFRMRVNELKRLEKLRLDIARNLHDDMGSQLSQLKMLSEYNAKVKGIKDFNTISEKLAEVMQNMSEIVWSINPKYDSFAITISKLVEYGIDIYEKKGIKFHLDIEESKNDISLNLESRRHIYLIFKEAMNNSLKYSEATDITFSVKILGKHTVLKLQDNGVGFDSNLIKMGNGLMNMQARAEAMRCKLNISSLGGSTIVELVI